MSIQQRNDELVDILSADFQPRNEPNFAWKSCVSSVLALPGLRAFYPMSAVGAAGEAQDVVVCCYGRKVRHTCQRRNLSNFNMIADLFCKSQPVRLRPSS